MELTRIGFQRSEDSPEKFSDDYRDWLEYELKRAGQKPDPIVQAMQLEVLRRQRVMQGDFSTTGLNEALESVIEVGRSRLEIHMNLILDFVTQLENDFDGPKRWVCTSHYDLVLWEQNYEEYTATPEGDEGILSVAVATFTPPEEPSLVLQKGRELLLETPDVRKAAEEAFRVLTS